MSAPFINAHTHSLTNDPDTEILYNLNLNSPKRMLYTSAGIHPADIHKFSLEQLNAVVSENNYCAIGECGLDSLAQNPMTEQNNSFQQQIMLAEKNKLPMVIHCVRCHYEVLHFRKQAWHASEIPWLIHGFRGKEQLASDFIKAGCLLSLSPVWLMHLESWPEWLPYGSFLLETDEAPVSIYDVYRKTAELKQDSLGTVRDELYKTFHRFLPQRS